MDIVSDRLDAIIASEIGCPYGLRMLSCLVSPGGRSKTDTKTDEGFRTH